MTSPPKADRTHASRRTPGAPCWAVTFSSSLSEDRSGYAEAAERMFALAAGQPGFLHMESHRDADDRGVTICYWASMEAIEAWRDHPEHLAAKAEGRARWYKEWDVRIEFIEARR